MFVLIVKIFKELSGRDAERQKDCHGEAGIRKGGQQSESMSPAENGDAVKGFILRICTNNYVTNPV